MCLKLKILSVSKFTKDNKVYFEFFYDKCFVKCQETKEVLLRGEVKDGLYTFPDFQIVKSVNDRVSAMVSTANLYGLTKL